MKVFVPCFVVALSSCAANTPAPANPNSVPNIQLSLTQARGVPGAIFVSGGIYDGAAAGQTATFVVTPNDDVICTFQTDPMGDDAADVSRVTANRLTVAGAYAAMSGALLPNLPPENSEVTSNFKVEVRGAAGLSSSVTGFGDPRFDTMVTYFQANPTPCWNFG